MRRMEEAVATFELLEGGWVTQCNEGPTTTIHTLEYLSQWSRPIPVHNLLRMARCKNINNI
jgi:hypothetical protein